jgi:hypothetical protein
MHARGIGVKSVHMRAVLSFDRFSLDRLGSRRHVEGVRKNVA